MVIKFVQNTETDLVYRLTFKFKYYDAHTVIITA